MIKLLVWLLETYWGFYYVYMMLEERETSYWIRNFSINYLKIRSSGLWIVVQFIATKDG